MENNTRTTSVRFFFSSATFATALAFSTPSAWAEEVCETDTCPQGFVCELTSTPCATIDCAEGEECAATCDQGTHTTCVRAACESDADCGTTMVCAEQTSWECDSVAEPCAVGEECVREPESTCTEQVRKECTPRWELPCTVAADCGAGFECVEGMSGTCSGGATPSTGQDGVTSGSGGTTGEAGAGADASENPVTGSGAPDCVSEPTGTLYCQPIEVACQQDSDCPEEWSCIDNPEGMCWADSEGNSGCTTPDPARLCQPPYAGYGGHGVAEDEGTAALGSSDGAGNDLVTENQSDTGPAVRDVSTDGESSDEVRADTDGADQAEEGDDANSEDATATAGDSSGSSSTEEPSSSKPESSGCSVQPFLGGQAGSFASVLLGMAVAVAARRRRSR